MGFLWYFSLFGILSGILTHFIKKLATPQNIEYYYSNGIYSYVRIFVDLFNESVPFAVIYPVLILFLAALIFILRKCLQYPTAKQKIFHSFFSLAGLAGFMIFLFQE